MRAIFTAIVAAVLLAGTAQADAGLLRRFELGDWYPTCALAGSNCWLDAIHDGGITRSQFRIQVEYASTGVRTGGEFFVECIDGAEIEYDIPGEIQEGWSSGWIDNPCLDDGGIRKITMRAGLNSAFTGHEGVITYYLR